jgi:Uma2 family endonuclease
LKEYGFLEIPEYWIVDPLIERVTVCVAENQFYDATESQGDEPIQSAIFPELALSTAQIMRGQL